MFWVVQSNLYNEFGYASLLEALERLQVQYAIVKTVPGIHRLLPADFDSFSYQGLIDEVAEVPIDESGLVMTCGTTTLARIANQRGWRPGSFLNDNFDHQHWLAHWGSHMLNADCRRGLLGDMVPMADTFFVRPAEDSKSFDGKVMTAAEFEQWRRAVLTEDNKLGKRLDGTVPIVMATRKAIHAEYRFFIVDGELVTWSQYRLGSRVTYLPTADDGAIAFARAMISRWQPARAFVLDIAGTPDGWKIIEVNNINSAGFYATNVGKFVAAIESMTF